MNIFIGIIEGNNVRLTEEESWHCAKVLRHRVGDRIRIIDGKGQFFNGILTLVDPRNCLAAIEGEAERQAARGYRLHLAIAPTKQIDRIEWMLEKAVETGIDEISLITCKNSERKQVNADRLRKITGSAVKQSLQATIPIINDLITFEIFLKSRVHNGGFIAHCGPGEKTDITAINFRGAAATILIGPEGDFTGQEVEMATHSGFQSISLSETRLRTETAGLIAVMAASLLSRQTAK